MCGGVRSDQARARPDVGPDHPDVLVTLDGDCLTVQRTGDPFGRVFGARVGAPAGGSLQGRLERGVRVAAGGEPACDGVPVALSSGAAAVLPP